jgi:hypothetical protein
MSSDKYIHLDVEDRIYSYWEKNELFKPRSNSKKYSVVIPTTKCNWIIAYGARIKQFNSRFFSSILSNE